VKAGETPEACEKNPAKNRQKDKDARWTKKRGKSFFGYKNHVNADARHKLIRQYDVTDASAHDSRTFDRLVNQANTSEGVYADSAYRSAQTKVKLRARATPSRLSFVMSITWGEAATTRPSSKIYCGTIRPSALAVLRYKPAPTGSESTGNEGKSTAAAGRAL
jgi:Transposase DDE domain